MDRRRRRRLAQMRITVGIILAVALIIGFGLVGFRTRHVEVVGNNHHSAEEIRDDLIRDFASSNSLYFSWKYRNPGEEPLTPYLSSVQAKLKSPGSIRITVNEKPVVGGIVYGGSYVYFDETGLVLEITDTKYDSIPLISGISMDEPQLYQKLPVTNAAMLRTMLNLSSLIGGSGLIADEISFDEALNMFVTIGDIKVELGQDEYLEEKISNLVTIYPKITGQTGILKLSSYTGKSDDIQFEEVVPEEVIPEGTDADGGWENAGIGENGEITEGVSQDNEPAAGGDAQGTAPEEGADTGTGEVVGVEGFMVFDSSGTLRYDARVIGGQVLDKYGNPIPGCSVNEDGNVVDAYWNVIDPMTGTLAQ